MTCYELRRISVFRVAITEFRRVARLEQRKTAEHEDGVRGSLQAEARVYNNCSCLSSRIHPVYTTLHHALAQSSPATRRLGSLGRMDLRSCGPFSRCGFSPSSASDAGLATVEGPGATFTKVEDELGGAGSSA